MDGRGRGRGSGRGRPRRGAPAASIPLVGPAPVLAAAVAAVPNAGEPYASPPVPAAFTAVPITPAIADTVYAVTTSVDRNIHWVYRDMISSATAITAPVERGACFETQTSIMARHVAAINANVSCPRCNVPIRNHMTQAQAVSAYNAHAAAFPLTHVSIQTVPAAALVLPPGAAARLGITAPIAVAGAAPAAAAAPVISTNSPSRLPPTDVHKLLHQTARDRTKYKQRGSGATIAREFLDSLEITLRQSPVSPVHWIYLLPMLVPDTNTTMQRWIETHITTPNFSWNAARLAFLSHYETADWVDLQRVKFGTCVQESKESVQQYTDRYAAFMLQLSISDHDTTNILKYMEGLHTDVKFKLFDYRSIMRNLSHPAAGIIANPAWDYDSFQLISEKAISFEAELSLHRDQSRPIIKQSSRYHDASSSSPPERSSAHKRKSNDGKAGSGSGKRAKGDLYCKNHPNSTSHATKDCQVGASSKGASVSFNPRISVSPHTTRVIPPTASNKESSFDTVTCYLCGKPGHIKPNCPDKNKTEERGGRGGKHVKARKASVSWDKSNKK